MKICRSYRLGSLLLCLILPSGCNGSGDGSGSFGSVSPPPAPSTSLRLLSITTGLTSPVFATAPVGDRIRLFIVQQRGQIRIFDLFARTFRSPAFLDITGLLSTGEEQGLLGLAFDPAYQTNRRFYVFYTDTSGKIVVARYLRDATSQDQADPSSAVTILTVPHPGFSDQNGGMLAFGPDQCLYVGIGDGGGNGDPNNNGQNTNQQLGKILRIDPNTGDACTNVTSNPFSSGGGEPRVWSLGLRNPWRFSFDRLTADLYIGDVGQDCREEIDIASGPNAGRGINYGWRVAEGFALFDPPGCPGNTTPPNTPPIIDYLHTNGACSVTGGYVYRGTAQPSLVGTYFYGDFCTGFVRSFRLIGGQVTQQNEWPLLAPGGNITSFAEDAQGELYLMTQQGGLFRVVPN
jgi:glucose/arabinose dehydrogenase